MHPEPIQRLIEYFKRLPGIGPRQASRFAYTMLDEDPDTIEGFGEALKALARSVGRCRECYRSVEESINGALCVHCKEVELQAILVVERDQDLETIAKVGVWRNGYHVLGGTISLLNEKSRVTDRIKGLYERLKTRTDTREKPLEVVLATSATTEGDATALYIERILEPYTKNKKIVLTRLGRGISTGTEMEFADSETLKNAFNNRK